jgi:hypothetical protein
MSSMCVELSDAAHDVTAMERSERRSERISAARDGAIEVGEMS